MIRGWGCVGSRSWPTTFILWSASWGTRTQTGWPGISRATAAANSIGSLAAQVRHLVEGTFGVPCKLETEADIWARLRYIRDQEYPPLVWFAPGLDPGPQGEPPPGEPPPSGGKSLPLPHLTMGGPPSAWGSSHLLSPI